MTDKYVPLDRLRPFTETLSVAFELMRNSFKPLMTLVLTIAGPLFVLGAIGTEYSQVSGYEDLLATLGKGSAPESDVHFAIPILAMLVNLFAGIIAYVVVLIFFLEYHRLKRVPTVEEVRAALTGVWPRAFGGYLGSLVLVVLGLILLVVPGIYLYVALSLVVPAQFAEGLSVGEAMKRSRYLIRNDWWWAFLYLVLIFFCAGIVSWIANIPGSALGFIAVLTKDTGGEAVTMSLKIVGAVIRVAAQIITACLSSLTAVAIIVLYYREVERTEGTGLLERVATIGGNEAPTNYEPS